MKNLKNFKNIILLLLVTSVAFTSCSSDDDNGPDLPDYSTYFFDNFLAIDDVELVASNGYSFTVTLSRSSATQADDINLSLTDASGKFGFVGGATTSTVSFASNESSKIINIEPLDASDVSIFETYNITVSIVPPSGTTMQTEFSKSVEASVAVNWVSAGQAEMALGWAFAAVVYGSATKTLELEKDSNVDYYKCKQVYGTDFDILFGIDNGTVIIEDNQPMLITDPAVFGIAAQINMVVNSAVYDAGAKTVTINYDMVRDDGGIFAGIPFDNITDVITLP